MPLEGYIDVADPTHISGWVFDTDHPDRPLTVDIFHDQTRLASILADQFRPDLLAAGKGNGQHAFSFSQPPTSTELPLIAQVNGWLIPLGSFLSASRYQGKFNHPLDRGLPLVQTGFTPSPPPNTDLQLIDRLIDAYHRAVADSPPPPPDMWSAQMNTGHREFADLLQKKDRAAVADYLANAHAKPLTNGITQGDVTHTLRARADARQRVAAPFVDYLASLAEFLGLLTIECSDQASTWAENLYRNPQELLDRINTHLGFDITPPPVIGGLFGLATSTGILSGRDLMSLHSTLRIQQISQAHSITNAHICEIGGGLGGVAHYAHRLKLGPYTIIDLPIINVLQGYYLSQALPAPRIGLMGETGDADIFILPTQCFEDKNLQFDLLLNQDSMPEIHPDISLAYLRAAKQKSPHLFLSINQEAQARQTADSVQCVVSQLVRDAGGYKRLSRNRHWLRSGYVEEIFRTE